MQVYMECVTACRCRCFPQRTHKAGGGIGGDRKSKEEQPQAGGAAAGDHGLQKKPTTKAERRALQVMNKQPHSDDLTHHVTNL